MKLSKIKTQGVHKKNVHKGRYNFDELTKSEPELKKRLTKNPKGETTINFSDSHSVMLLNRALLKHFYGINGWQIPKDYLCPPIPSRADYVHRLHALLLSDGLKVGEPAKAIDIGTGANAVYALIGASTYDWNVVASDISQASISNVNSILAHNPKLKTKITPFLQSDSKLLFNGVISPDTRYDVTLCNPPFHASKEEAVKGTTRKVHNLSQNKGKADQSVKKQAPTLNFGGQHNELWCQGGEYGFVSRMIKESGDYRDQVLWFTCLISKGDNVRPLRKLIEKQGAEELRVIQMEHGNKVSRFIAWTYQNSDARKHWFLAAN
ncbi:23S rRNA (adenine(1618)-N(6))-methyltransferase RlmF [Vibrio sp.]|nr:23S rRNA (adenine(1618)-N(6))-methyltransferase RlmF [Vibrio sp.]